MKIIDGMESTNEQQKAMAEGIAASEVKYVCFNMILWEMISTKNLMLLERSKMKCRRTATHPILRREREKANEIR